MGAPRVIESLSVCMIAHNEQNTIRRALDSVSGWAAQTIVLDCGSVDATAQVAREAGVEVYSVANDLPERSKNRSFAYADREWILIVDADEEIPESLWSEIASTLARSPIENGFKIPRRNFYFGSPLMHGGNYPDRQLRLFRRGRGRYLTGAIHESMTIDGTVGSLTMPFDHHPYPTFTEWMRKLDYYTNYGAYVLAQSNVPLSAASIRRHMITRPLRRWIERLFVKRGIRDGVPGVLAATSDFVTHVLSFGKYWYHAQPDSEPLPDVTR